VALNPSAAVPKGLFAPRKERTSIQVSPILLETAAMDIAAVYARLGSCPDGLQEPEAAVRLAALGPNILARDRRPGFAKLLWHAVINPLVILLAILASISFATGDARAAIVMLLMIVLGVGLKLVQEAKADNAAAKLKAMISVTATAVREGMARETPVAELVPGDVVRLAAGDMIPADVRIVAAKDLFVIQGALTGESFPVEKFEVKRNVSNDAPLETSNIAFLGTRPGKTRSSAGWRRHSPNRRLRPRSTGASRRSRGSCCGSSW
jgi:P-type Mg2+ transporter